MITILALTNCCFIFVWFVTWLIFGDDPWWITLPNRCFTLIFLPLPIWTALSAIKRRYFSLACVSTASTIFLFYSDPT